MTPKSAARRAMLLTSVFDLTMAGLAMIAAHIVGPAQLLVDPTASAAPVALATVAFILAAAAGLFVNSIHRQVWRHIGLPDTIRLLQAIGFAVFLYLFAMVALNGLLTAPVPTFVMAVLFWTAAMFAGRMVARARSTHTPLQIFQRLPKNSQPILLVGDPDSWIDVLRRLEGAQGPRKMRVLGLIELEATEPGRAVRGFPIFGSIDDLDRVIELLRHRYEDTPWIAVTGRARKPDVMVRIIEIASAQHAEIMALSDNEAAQILEAVRPSDLLARPERELDPAPVRKLIRGAHVLITGAGGSIGAELSRQVAAEQPASIILVDCSEFNLYQIDAELEDTCKTLSRYAYLADVRNPARMAKIFTDHRPDIVIHAAALKHVPLMEHNPCEAVMTNTGGAAIVAREAAKAGTKRFVYISTDKAVNPDNVMGASKRAGELAITKIAYEVGLAVSIVRFGNVLGSSGSVVPRFEKQIASGGPVTITDPLATRYFMTKEEASALVLQAAALQKQNGQADFFVLDMGEPVSILRLAETMIRLKGKVPYVDVQIEVTGLRDGEKLHERLTTDDEELSETTVSGISRVLTSAKPGSLFGKQLASLLDAAERYEVGDTMRLLTVLVPDFIPGSEAPDARQSA